MFHLSTLIFYQSTFPSGTVRVCQWTRSARELTGSAETDPGHTWLRRRILSLAPNWTGQPAHSGRSAPAVGSKMVTAGRRRRRLISARTAARVKLSLASSEYSP
jgi:hypothetical protein